MNKYKRSIGIAPVLFLCPGWKAEKSLEYCCKKSKVKGENSEKNLSFENTFNPCRQAGLTIDHLALTIDLSHLTFHLCTLPDHLPQL
ncbi:MAG: hypothetical protein H7X88_08480 [Gloeobacteraceae cyanobacterium ES-bin-316]|nr:hypothetical protein [Ferruginibacter sp.]